MNLNIFKYTVASVLIVVKTRQHLVIGSLFRMGPESMQWNSLGGFAY